MGLYELIGYILLFGAFFITFGADVLLRSNYNKYQKKKSKGDFTGADVAREILKKNNCENVYVVETRGFLTDHYDASQKVIRLSKEIYRGNSIAAISVAAHEVGHAIQDKENYFLLQVRSFFAPLASFGTKFGYMAILVGFFFGSMNFAWIGVSLLVFLLLFQLVTLPVELDASERAEKMLLEQKIISTTEKKDVSDMLKAAALTYVASLLTTIGEFVRIVFEVIMNSDER